MSNEKLVSAVQFCESHNLEISFIQNLQQYDLVQITSIQETEFFAEEQLPQVEKMARLHADLGINMEGIDAIQHLLTRVENLQSELRQLHAKLRMYEGEN